MNPVIEHAIRTGARVEYDMAGSAMVMDGVHQGALVGIGDLLAAYRDTVAEQRAELEQLRRQ